MENFFKQNQSNLHKVKTDNYEHIRKQLFN